MGGITIRYQERNYKNSEQKKKKDKKKRVAPK